MAEKTKNVRYLDTAQVGERLQCSRRTVIRLVEQGQFPGAFRLTRAGSSRWRIPESAVEHYINVARGLVRDDIEGTGE